MPTSPDRRFTACFVLIFCCVGWAFSFPGMKALTALGQRNAPGSSSVFLALWCVGLRFLLSALVLSPFVFSGGQRLSRSEIRQGTGIGFFAALGLVLQMDGANYTHASTAAFLTQGYCLWIPLWIAIRTRRSPAPVVWTACLLVFAGSAFLAGIRWNQIHLGRGEVENLLGSVSFAGQILWLERPSFSGNHVLRFTWVMFMTLAALCIPVAVFAAPTVGAVLTAYNTWDALLILTFLTAVCTLANFLLMNRWQPNLSATEAGLIYCTEPVFTSVVALFVPGWMSHFFHLDYPNELLTWNILLGGGLILSANILLQLRPPPPIGSAR